MNKTVITIMCEQLERGLNTYSGNKMQLFMTTGF